MEKELKDLKSVLRSLVVSSPAQVDVRSLQRDYRNMMGSPIPIVKYGYRDILSFLKERCSDCFLFQGLPSNPVLTLIVPESLKHIDQFVQKQKPSAITKMKGKRRSVLETISKPPERTNLIHQTFIRPLVSTQHLNSRQPQAKPPDIKTEHIDRTNHIPPNKIYNSTKDLTDSTKSTTNLKSNNEENSSSPIVENGFHNGNVRNFLKKRLPMYDSSQYLDSEECSEPDKVSSKGDNDSGRVTSSSQSSTKKAQLEELKCEIHELIKEHENGIWSTDLMRLYRERYSRELNFNRFGHHNINSLLCAMEDRVAFCTEGGGVRVRDARRAPAPAPALAPRPRPRAPARAPSLCALPVDPDDALPGIDFEPDVFPPDCMHFMESIPALALADVCAGAMLEVAVGEVYSPSHFWLQRLGPDYHHAMDDIMDEMSEYYNSGEGRSRVLARGALRPGHYCSSVYERDWHRSLIIKILDADTVKVRHVDYGTVDTVAAGALRPLLRRWARLPAQAARARLAGLRPGAGGRRWPHAAAAHFLHLVRDRRFVANVVALDAEEDTIETFLIDTSGADDVCVTAEMIRAGHADARPDSALRTGECYLYPRFEALESGDTPNFAEIHRYLADGISLEYVEAYRRHVPAALPAPAPAAPSAARLPPPLELLNRVPLLRLGSSPPSSPSPPPASHAPARPSSPPTARSPSPPIACSPSPPITRSPSPAAPPATVTVPPPSVPAPALPAPPRCVPPSAPRPPLLATPPAPRPPLLATPPAPRPPLLATPPAPRPPLLATPPTPLPAPPPPPAHARAGAGSVRLSLQECDMYSLLSALDPEAAHCYMLSALRRAAVHAHVAPHPAPPPSVLNPHAPEFRFAPPPPRFAPPPRFTPPTRVVPPPVPRFSPPVAPRFTTPPPPPRFASPLPLPPPGF